MQYGLVMGATSLMSFVIVLYGKADGELGVACNREPSSFCDPVFKARSTVFATLTFEVLLYVCSLSSPSCIIAAHRLVS